MVVDKYCQIIEKDTEAISVFWKASHIVCLLIASVCSLMATWNLLYIIEVFGNSCILYANLTFTNVNSYQTIGEMESNVSFHNPLTIWGNEEICSYSKCSYMFSMVVGMILMGFFLIFPKGGYDKHNAIYNEAYKLIPWGVCASVIMTILVGIAYSFTKHGMNQFTYQIYQAVANVSDCRETNCADEFNTFTLIFNRSVIPITQNILMLRITSFAAFAAWVILIAVLLLRMIIGVDFRIVVYHLKPAPGERDFQDSESSVSSESFTPADDRVKETKILRKTQSKTLGKSASVDEQDTYM